MNISLKQETPGKALIWRIQRFEKQAPGVYRLSGSLKCSCFLCVYSVFWKVSSVTSSHTQRKWREKKCILTLSTLPKANPLVRWLFSVFVCVCVCRVSIWKMNQGLSDMDDNGIKLKSKLNFILYFVFWLKHEFCQLLPFGCQILICMRLNQAVWYNGNIHSSPPPLTTVPATVAVTDIVTENRPIGSGWVQKTKRRERETCRRTSEHKQKWTREKEK